MRRQRSPERVGDEVDRKAALPDFSHRLGDDAGIVLREPILEQRVRHPDGHGRVLGDEAGRLEPGVEAVPVHLGFDPRKNLIPEVHFFEKSPWPTFAPPGADFRAITAMARRKPDFTDF